MRKQENNTKGDARPEIARQSRMNPQEQPYPEDLYRNVTIKASLRDDWIWSVYCPEWQCELHGEDLTETVSRILSDIEKHNEEEINLGLEEMLVSQATPKPTKNRWIGNTICEATAMDPRNDGRASS
jgi:predicted RNase H-like HicB family nuclease